MSAGLLLGSDLPVVRRAVVFGFAFSGLACARALIERGVAVTATDASATSPVTMKEPMAGLRLVLGGHPADVCDGADLVVVSPGVPLDLPALVAARGHGTPIIGEIELAARLLPGRVVGITGTNGKSTTTSLTACLLNAAGFDAVACGNLGTPWSWYANPVGAASAAPTGGERIWVVELSSFQLETTRTFAPDIAVHLNLTPDHLDRHGSLAAYGAAKARIFAFQRADQVAVLNADDPTVAALTVRARRVLFSRAAVPAGGVGCVDGVFVDGGILDAAGGGAGTIVARRDDLPVPGAHNTENALAAIAVARALGATPAAIVAGLRAFQPLKHRMSLVRTRAGVRWFNDSKGTNIDATLKCLEGFDDGRVVIILGGKDKGDDFARLVPLVRQKAHTVVTIGAAGPAIATAFEAPSLPPGPRIVRAEKLVRAIVTAAAIVRAGDVVLLSPACASFDQFRNFGHRGDVFDAFVSALPEAGTRGCRNLTDLPRRVHFVGIGGIGMSALAALQRRGHVVTGSDLEASPTTARLAALGIAVAPEGHRAENLGDAEAVVFTAAVRNANVEVTAAEARGLTLVGRAELLGMVMAEHRGIAIAGAHGKTTTTAMTGMALRDADLDPTVIVGGYVRGLDDNLAVGGGAWLVAEADEYNRSFLALAPAIAVINNIDREHLDTYFDMDDVIETFAAYAQSVPAAHGVVVLGIDNEHVAALAPRVKRRVITFGLEARADVRAIDVDAQPDHTAFDVVVRGHVVVHARIALAGLHNVRNALAVFAVAEAMAEPALTPAVVAASLGRFLGVERRLEWKGARGGVDVIDDYAHHPTEIAATLDAARQRYPGRRLVVLFQPHLFTRTRDHAADFARTLALADRALVLPVYPAREQPIDGVTSALITAAAAAAGTPPAQITLAPDVAHVVPALSAELRTGDVLITMGAGDVTSVGPAWLAGG